MSEQKYEPLQARAARLIEKGTQAWQEVQRLAMEENDLFDSVVLLGQQLWLPHHELDGSLYSVSLRLAVHYPPSASSVTEERVAQEVEAIAARQTDEHGRVAILLEVQAR